MTPLLCCQDGTIYSLRDSTFRHRLPLDGIPTSIQLYQNDGGTSGEWVVFGTSLGQIGLVRWSRAGPSIQWVMQLPSQTTVTSLDFYDVSDSGASQLILGRDDGVVEIYLISAEDDEIHNIPTLIFSQVQSRPMYCSTTSVPLTNPIIRIVMTALRPFEAELSAQLASRKY